MYGRDNIVKDNAGQVMRTKRHGMEGKTRENKGKALYTCIGPRQIYCLTAVATVATFQ